MHKLKMRLCVFVTWYIAKHGRMLWKWSVFKSEVMAAQLSSRAVEPTWLPAKTTVVKLSFSVSVMESVGQRRPALSDSSLHLASACISSSHVWSDFTSLHCRKLWLLLNREKSCFLTVELEARFAASSRCLASAADFLTLFIFVFFFLGVRKSEMCLGSLLCCSVRALQSNWIPYCVFISSGWNPAHV